MKSFAFIIIKSVFFLIAILLIYLVYYWWDMGRLRAFCDDIKIGTAVTKLPQIADNHGINPRWVKGDGMFSKVTSEWSFYVPSAASVGANVCAIHHNKSTVISAVIEID